VIATEKHFVTFYSPGTFVAETTTREIGEWNRMQACRMAKDIVERHGARPFGFRFVTRLCADDVLDSRGGTLRVEPREIRRSGMHHLGGTIATLADVEARNDPKEEILRSNMRCNKIAAVVENCNSYKSVHPFEVDDLLLDPDTGTARASGRDYQ
jgi:hypothetical protein